MPERERGRAEVFGRVWLCERGFCVRNSWIHRNESFDDAEAPRALLNQPKVAGKLSNEKAKIVQHLLSV